MTKAKITEALCLSGLLLVAAGAFLPFVLGPGCLPAKIVLTAGAALLLIGRLFTPYKGKIFRVKRLFAIEKWSAIFFCTSAFFMWYSENPQEWIVFLLAGAFIQLYTSIAIPHTEKKALKQEEAERRAAKSKDDKKA